MTSKIKVNILADGGDNAIITSDGAGSFTASSGLASSVQSVGGIQNTPAFVMYATGNTTINSNAVTKIALQGNFLDTDSGVDTTNSKYTIPSGKGGTYVIGGAVNMGASVSSLHIGLYINGNYQYTSGGITLNNWIDYGTMSAASRTMVMPLNAGDYIELYTLHGGGSTALNGTLTRTRLWGYRLIGA